MIKYKLKWPKYKVLTRRYTIGRHLVRDVSAVLLHPDGPLHGVLQGGPVPGRPGLQVGAGQPQLAPHLHQLQAPGHRRVGPGRSWSGHLKVLLEQTLSTMLVTSSSSSSRPRCSTLLSACLKAASSSPATARQASHRGC